MKKMNPLPNMVMSPYSLGYMMAMVANIANGPTKTEVNNKLQQKKISKIFGLKIRFKRKLTISHIDRVTYFSYSAKNPL